MIMGQIKLIHEHYDSKPWASIISATLFAMVTVLGFIAKKDMYWINTLLFIITLLPISILLVIDIIWKNKPILTVYNDRLEVKKAPSSGKTTEILYSDIKNMSLEASQLRIWLDVDSIPSCYYLGAKLNKVQETYDILRTAYDQYNQERGIKPVPLADMPNRTKSLGQIVFMVTTISVVILLFVLNHLFH